MFFNWLELYSLNEKYFRQINYKVYTENGNIVNIEIPYKESFIRIQEILKNVEWKILNLQEYDDSKYSKINTL